jgi:hypothetical protein
MNDKLISIVETAVEKELCFHEKHLNRLLSQSFHIVDDSVEERGEEMADIHFQISKFLKDLPKSINGIKRSQLYAKGADLLCLILNTLDVEVTKQECFIFFHLRELGKFRTKEDIVFKELKSEWGMHRDYVLELDEFLEAIRELKNHGLIGHKRGTITLNDATVFRYKMAN